MTVVLAKNFQDYKSWCRQAGVNPIGREYAWARDAEALRGFSNVGFQYVGDYWNHPTWDEIQERILIIETFRPRGKLLIAPTINDEPFTEGKVSTIPKETGKGLMWKLISYLIPTK